MTPRVAPWLRRQFPDLMARIQDQPGTELVSVHRADIWANGWVVRLYRPAVVFRGTAELVSEGTGPTADAAFDAALAGVTA